MGLHVATAAALLVYFWRDWVRIIGGFFTSIRYRRVETPSERLAWLIVLATIPVGVSGLLLEHTFRTVLGRPIPAAVFLTLNGGILYAGERLRRRAAQPVASPALEPVEPGRYPRAHGPTRTGRRTTWCWTSGWPSCRMRRGTGIGAAQVLALLPGISRSGATMVAGLIGGLTHEEAARFSFLLATPVILAAGALKIPDLTGPLGAGIHGQVLAGSAASFIAALISVRFLSRYFRTRTLTPFAIYCTVAGLASLIYLSVR